MMKGNPTTTLEEKMALLDLASASSPPTKNGDSQIYKQNKENLSRGKKFGEFPVSRFSFRLKVLF